MADDSNRVLVDSDNVEKWVASAHNARAQRHALSQIGAPLDGSRLLLIDAAYPWDKASIWCRSFLDASVEHMMMWAEYAAPFKFREDAVVEQSLRPAMTLSRAALEAASQAVWILDGGNPRECARRHVALLLDDLTEQRKAAIGMEAKKVVQDRTDEVWSRLGEYVTEKELAFPGYLNVVKAATSSAGNTKSGLLGDPIQVERIYRASAGSAHGKRWPSIELTAIGTTADGSRSLSIPDPEVMSHMLDLAASVLARGVVYFATSAGYGPQLTQIYKAAFEDLAQEITLVPGATVDDLLQRAAEGTT